MKNLSFTYLLFAAVSAAAAAFCLQLVYLAVTTGSSGGWLFAAFALLFALLPSAAAVRLLAPRFTCCARLDRLLSPKPKDELNTRFGPHWMLLLAMLAIVVAVLAAIVEVIREFF